MAKLKENVFYYAALVFAVALPFSEGLISTSIGLLLIASLIQFNKANIKIDLKQKRNLFVFAAIFLVYLGWLGFTHDWKWAGYDLKKNISYLVIPLAFFIAPAINSYQQKRILKVFSLAVLFSSVITLIYFYFQKEHSVLGAQEYGFIHHIRFSFELIFAIVIFLSFLFLKRERLLSSKIGLIAACFFLFMFLLWHQSLTGLLTFMGTAFLSILLLTKKLQNRFLKISIYTILILLVVLPMGYLKYAINSYYDVDVIQPDKLEQHTEQGNIYLHDLDNNEIENGHFVWLYVCEEELENEWNKRSTLKYKERDKNNYQVKYTLIRYLASKNLKKDAEGVRELTQQDIINIESGISNYILANKGLSLYPRIYVSIWELDSYFKTGNANHRSLAQRIEYSKAALTIIKDNLWFGVGTGNWKKAYADAYRLNESKMNPARYGDAHNQYLNYMVKFGIVGLLIILFAIFYPIIKLKAYKNPVFLLFMVIMLLGNLGDSNFETHVGSNFFIFFYCLMVLPKSEKLAE